MENKPTPSTSLSKLDWRDYGKTTPVKNQKLPICWSYGTMAGVEHNLLLKDFTKYVDLSELSFAYHARNRNEGADLLGNTNNDLRDAEVGMLWSKEGYDARQAAYTLLQWNSLKNEEEYYRGYKHDFQFKTTDVVWLNNKDKNEIKEAIVKYGSVVFGYVEYEKNSGGHVATIVGWDDNVWVEKFDRREREQGAFLVKNSWGENWGNQGYFWLSYEALAQQAGDAFSVNVEKGDKYDFNYYYDGLFGDVGFQKHSSKAAVLFRAQGGDKKKVEVLEAINVGLKNAKGKKLKVKVYKDIGYDFKTIDTTRSSVFEKTYEIKNDGLTSFELKEEGKSEGIELDKNKSFAIEVEIEGGGGDILFSHEEKSGGDFSYYYDEDNSWKNSLVEHRVVARIKAWTKLKTRTTSSEVKDLGNADVILKQNTFRWGEKVVKPTVKYDNVTLKEGEHYTLEATESFEINKRYYHPDNVLNGNGLITITGKGEYSGQVKVPYFYKIAPRANLESIKGKTDYSQRNSLDSTKWQWTSDGAFLNYVGEYQNHYRKTSFSVAEIREFIKEDVKEEKKEQVETLKPVETKMVQVQQVQETRTQEKPLHAEVHTPTAPIVEPNTTTSTSVNSSVNYGNEGSNLITGLTGGAGAAMGLFALMPLLFKKFFWMKS